MKNISLIHFSEPISLPLISCSEKLFQSESLGCLDRVQATFRQALQMTHRAFTNLWDQAVLMGHIHWPSNVVLTKEIQETLEKVLRGVLVYHGPGCSFDSKSSSNPQVHKLVGYLLGKEGFPAECLDCKILKAIFISKNPELLRCMREEFRNMLGACAEHLPIPGSADETLFQAFVSNCLALLPFSYPEAGEEYVIPQKVGGEWRACKYVIDRPIPLTPNVGLSPIYAFGLTSAEGPPLLTIIGTTFPAGDGFLATLLSDVTPGLSVGHAAYWFGRDKLTAWFEGKSQVRLFGMSLGGALCFHVLRNHKEKIGEVDVHNPAGLYPWNWRESFDEQRVNIYYQENDLVATMGSFPTGKGVSVYRVFGNKSEHFGLAHARIYSGCSETTIIRSSSEYENGRCIRKFLTVLHLTVTTALGIFGMITLAFLCYKTAGMIQQTRRYLFKKL